MDVEILKRDRIWKVGLSGIEVLQNGYVANRSKNGGMALSRLFESDWATVLPQTQLKSCLRQLQFLPEAFGSIHGLLLLDLSINELKVLPESISRLEKLEELNVSSNFLESLPKSIGRLQNLKVLNATGNKLSALPDSICQCRSLSKAAQKPVGPVKHHPTRCQSKTKAHGPKKARPSIITNQVIKSTSSTTKIIRQSAAIITNQSFSFKSFIYKSSSFKASLSKLHLRSFSAGYTNTASEQPPLQPIHRFNLKSSANLLYRLKT
ncbi:hypothetical protein ACFX2J_044141 [Malus domestica]